MAYASWSVVFGEQPSAAKWNILGTNDASFNDGTGIANMSMSTTSVSNPYKFSAYRNSAQNSGSGAFAIINFDTELYDTNSNFDVSTNVGRYTAPVTGYYHFMARASASTTGQFLVALYKNGAQYQRGAHVSLTSGSATNGSTYSNIVSATAGDYFEIYSFGTGGALEVGTSGTAGGYTYFSGMLISRT